MNLPKEPISEAASKLFSLSTPIAQSIMELILLLILIGGAGYLYDRGPVVLRLPAGIFMTVGTIVGLLLFFRVFVKALLKIRED
jgi:hypothetical protein